MKISLALCLPRDAESVSSVRHLCRLALAKAGAAADVIADIEVAVSETCTNVLDHSDGVAEYEVRVEIDDEACEVIVIDVDGSHFGLDGHGLAPADGEADGGRGLHLMRSLMDVRFTFDPGKGAAVHLVKPLDSRTAESSSPLR